MTIGPLHVEFLAVHFLFDFLPVLAVLGGLLVPQDSCSDRRSSSSPMCYAVIYYMSQRDTHSSVAFYVMCFIH